MESTAPANAIQVSAAVRDLLADRFTFRPRGEIEMKGIGPLPVFLLEGRKDPTP
jgi:class 3 adenylate cyclase